VSLTIGIAIQGFGIREITLGALLSTIMPPLFAIVLAIAFRLLLTAGNYAWALFFIWMTKKSSTLGKRHSAREKAVPVRSPMLFPPEVPGQTNPDEEQRPATSAPPQRFELLILFVTGRCNARCSHCFYWQNLGRDHEGPTLSQIETLARTMPPFKVLLLSGGEPTLRGDLPAVVDCFYRHNHIRHVSIPTNGLLPARIVKLAQTIAAAAPELEVSFNLSIDGFAETHDRIRGIDGAFELATESIARLSRLKSDHPNLRVVVNSVICADTLSELASLARYFADTCELDGHFFELIRGIPREGGMKSLSPDALYQVYKQLLPIQEQCLHRRTSGLPLPHRLLRRITGTAHLVAQYQYQYRVFTQNARWPFPCQAGDAIAVVDFDGSMRVCELRDRSITLDAYDWNFERARNSPVMCEERLCAKQHVCDCTHVCFLTTSWRHSLITRFVALPLHYLRYKLTGII